MKNTVRSKIALGATLAAAAIANASPSGWISSDVKNNYTGGFGFGFGDYPVLQTDVGVNVGKGSFDVWTNYDSHLKTVNEHDFTVAYPVSMRDLTAKLSGMYFTFPRTTFNDAYLGEISFSHKKVPGVSLTLDKVWGKESGNGYSTNLAYNGSKSLNSKTNLNFGLSAVANSHLYTNTTGPAVIAGKIGLSRDITKNFSVHAEARYQAPIDGGKFGNTFRTRKTIGIGFNYNFGGQK